MKFLKKLSLQHLTHDQLLTLLVLSAGAAFLVLMALTITGDVKFTFDNSAVKQALSNPTSLGANMAWAASGNGPNFPAWTNSTAKDAAQNDKSENGEWSSPRACRIGPGSEQSCVRDASADWRRYAVFSIHEQGNNGNGKVASLVGKSTENRTVTSNWNTTNDWERTISEPGNALTIGTNSSIVLEWTCQDIQTNYFEDECGLGGVKMCETTRGGRTDQNPIDPIEFFNDAGGSGSGFDPGARKGSKTITPPYGTTNYRLTCKAVSGSTHNISLDISVNRPLPPAVNGSCGATQNVCAAGTLNDTADSASNYLWQCAGAYGGSTASCTLPKPVATAALLPNGTVSVAQGGTVSFSWSTTNVVSTACTVTRSPSATAPWSGSTTGNAGASRVVTFPASLAPGAYVYTLSGCTSTNGTPTPAADSVTVNVTAATAPAASISSTAATVNKGSATQLGWSCTNSATARVSNNQNATVWTTFPSVANPPGQSTGALSAPTTYTLVCTNASGVTATASQLVNTDICTDIAGDQPTAPASPCLNPGAVAGACVPANYTWNGSTCTANAVPDACPNVNGNQASGPCADAVCAGNGGTWSVATQICTPAPVIDIVSFTASPNRVKNSTPTKLSWEITGIGASTCQITSSPNVFSRTVTSANASGVNATDQSTSNITQTTILTLNCGASESLQETVTVVPEFEEI